MVTTYIFIPTRSYVLEIWMPENRIYLKKVNSIDEVKEMKKQAEEVHNLGK